MKEMIHFIGIGGIGMSALARIALQRGFIVSGSDNAATTITEELSRQGALIYKGHQKDHIKPSMVVVYSTDINSTNPEMEMALGLGLKVVHRSELMGMLIGEKQSLLVTGTHGKTTTSSLLSYTLLSLSYKPTFAVGGYLKNIQANSLSGSGEYFVAEADESDGSFLRLTPTVAVVTNIDRDHMDHYASYDEILAAFTSFIDKVPFYGAVCACVDDPGVRLILPKLRRRSVTFGLSADADVTAENIIHNAMVTEFTPVIDGKAGPRVRLKMPGRYNVLNSLASFAVGKVLDIPTEKVSASVSSFQGVLHRFTIIGELERVLVVDDYAHNPKKIATVLEGIRESWPGHRICAIFQPHRYSRVKHLSAEFAVSFSKADHVIVTPVYSAGEAPIEHCDHLTLASEIQCKSFPKTTRSVDTCQNLDHAVSLATDYACKHKEDTLNCTGVLLITLGAGDVQSVGSKILKNLTHS
ncbi:UDP-N-acetylmuramate--L-alanine ligase [bacterium]|nr:UDP-N-acetylmuramate--L-alanine ligase [bacterium]